MSAADQLGKRHARQRQERFRRACMSERRRKCWRIGKGLGKTVLEGTLWFVGVWVSVKAVLYAVEVIKRGGWGH